MAMAEMMLTLRQSHEKRNKFKIVGPALSDSLEPLAPVAPQHDLAGQSLFYRYYFGNAPLNFRCYFLFLSFTHSWSTSMLTGSMTLWFLFLDTARRPIPIASFQVRLDYGILYLHFAFSLDCFMNRQGQYEQTTYVFEDYLNLLSFVIFFRKFIPSSGCLSFCREPYQKIITQGKLTKLMFQW